MILKDIINETGGGLSAAEEGSGEGSGREERYNMRNQRDRLNAKRPKALLLEVLRLDSTW